MSSSTSHKPERAPARRPRRRRSDGGGDEGGGGGGGGGGGKLVKVAFARNQAEAEMLQGLLSEAGIPSVLKRSGGFDNPDFLAAGPRDVDGRLRRRRRRPAGAGRRADRGEGTRAPSWKQDRRSAPAAQPAPAGAAGLWIAVAVLAAAIFVWILYQLS